MKAKNTFRYTVALNIMMLLSCVQFSASAQPPDTVVIQGQLLDSGGVPIPGLRQYQVKFFDSATGGAQLGGTITDVTLISAEGLFAFPVVIPQAALDAAEAWYELAVDSDAPVPDGVDANDFFTERVKIHSVPFARVAGKAMNVDVDAIGTGSVIASEFDALSGVTGSIQSQMDTKADAANVYTKTEVDTSQSAQNTTIALKANTADVNTSQAAQDAAIALRYIFQWVVVTSGPVQAVGNRGYVINSATEITVTLPDSGVLAVGNVVRLSGMGAGGWRVAQNVNQQIFTDSLTIPDYSASWVPRDSNRNWLRVASSSDGTKLVAVDNGGQIYTSTDSGVTWVPRDIARAWYGVASSSDGAKLVAVVFGGQIYTSSDSGLTWTPRDSNRDWRIVASSADGTKLVATVYNGQIYTSTDSGLTWTPRDINRVWFGVASSADGTKLVATVPGAQIYTSTDSGVTWTPRDINRDWYGVASSADGSKLVALAQNGQIYTSTDSGLTWTPRDSNRVWSSVASSADGTKLVATVISGQLYTSTDSGLTWVPGESNQSWRGAASSADGTKLVVVVTGGQLYTYSSIVQQSTAGITGALTGGQHTAVELQYIGNDTFVPLSHEGSLGAL